MADEAEISAPAPTFTPMVEYGGFFARLLAYLADVSIILLAGGVIVAGASAALGEEIGNLLTPLVLAAGMFLYWPAMQSSARQATFGKSMMGLKVGDATGGRISFVRSLARELAKIISSAVFGIGFLMALFTGKKQALHDFVASTYVVSEGEAHPVRAIGVILAPIVLVVAVVVVVIGASVDEMMAVLSGEKPKPAVKKAAPVQVAKAAPKAGAQKPAAPAPAPAEMRRGTIVLPGTFMWDSKANAVGGGGDLWFQHKSDTERQITPQSGAAIAVAPKDAYEKLDAAELAKLQYSTEPLAGNDGLTALDPGAVLGMRTGDGRLTKIRVVGYKDSHDTTFPGNQVLTDNVKKLLASKPKIARYHVELEWVQYPAAALAVAPAAGSPASDKPAAEKPAEKPVEKVAEKSADKPAPADPGKQAEKPVALAEKPAPAPAPEAKKAAPGAVPTAMAPTAIAKAASEDAPKPAPRRRVAAPPKPMAEALPPPPPEPAPAPRYNDVMTAVLYGDRDGVSELLALGRWVDKPDAKGKTPLMIAVAQGDAATADLLLKAGANAQKAIPAARDQAMRGLLQRYSER